MCKDLDLSITDVLDLDLIAKVTNTVIDLDLVLEELLEGRDVEDLVAGRLRGVNDVLRKVRIDSIPSAEMKRSVGRVHTFWVTFGALPLDPLDF